MTQEDIELLATDICARVKYDVKVLLINNGETMDKYKTYLHPYLLDPIRVIAFINYKVTGYSKYKLNIGGEVIYIEDCMPYLRPMSSMTEEESAELSNIIHEWFDKELFYLTEEPFFEYALSRINYSISPLLFDWLNAHHFDYRGLIEKGLALQAPEGMYDIN